MYGPGTKTPGEFLIVFYHTTNFYLQVGRSSIDMQEETFDDLTLFDVTKDDDEDLDELSHTGSRSDRSRNSESSFLDMKSPNFDDFGKL